MSEETRNRYHAIYDRDFQPAEGDSHGWIQWKGTDVCMDLHCVCGYHGHMDGDFFYRFQCRGCGAKYAVGQNVKLIPLTADQIEPHDDFKMGAQAEERGYQRAVSDALGYFERPQ